MWILSDQISSEASDSESIGPWSTASYALGGFDAKVDFSQESADDVDCVDREILQCALDYVAMTYLENGTNVIDAISQVEEGDCKELEECDLHDRVST